MKKVLLSVLALSTAFLSSAQVILSVLDPAGIEGSYDFTYTDGWPNAADLTVTANAVQAFAAFVEDGTEGLNPQGNPLSQEGCGALENDLTDKIALIYRNTCDFGLKAANAEAAGAIAFIVINRENDLLNMAAGDFGENVSIPGAFVSAETGALIAEQIALGNDVEIYLGNKTGLFENDFGIYNKDIVYPGKTSIPAILAQNGSEFSYTPAAWVYNYGSLDQTAGILTVSISHNGTEIYSESVADLAIVSEDSLFVSLPEFSETSYDVGHYVVTFEVTFDGFADEFPGDNTVSTSFYINDKHIYANAETDENGDLIGGGGLRATGATSFGACIVFRDANASRLMLDGIHFAISKSGEESLDGEYIYTSAWEWENFIDLDDPAFGSAGIGFIGDGEFSFDNGEENGDFVFSSIRDANGEFIVMEDNKRYILCAETDAEDVFISFDGNINYYRNNEETDRQPYMLIRTPDFGLGFTDYYGTPAIAAEFINAAELGLAHQKDIVNITPYPNPAVSVLNIPVENLDGAASLEIVDVTGRSVKSENVTINGSILSVDVAGMPNGTYLFNMNFENGKSSTFRVVINK